MDVVSFHMKDQYLLTLRTKLGHIGCVARTNRFDFGEDPKSGYENFFFFLIDSSPLRDRAKNDI